MEGAFCSAKTKITAQRRRRSIGYPTSLRCHCVIPRRSFSRQSPFFPKAPRASLARSLLRGAKIALRAGISSRKSGKNEGGNTAGAGKMKDNLRSDGELRL